MQQKIVPLFVVLLFPMLVFSQEPEPVQVEIEVSLCQVDEAKLVSALNLELDDLGWIVFYDTAARDYQKNEVTLRLRVRSERKKDGTWDEKNPEATVKIRSFGTWTEREQIAMIGEPFVDHEFKQEADLFVNVDPPKESLTYLGLKSQRTLSVTHRLPKSSNLFTRARVEDWIALNKNSQAPTPFDCPFTDTQETLASEAAFKQKNLPIEVVSAFALTTWKTKKSSTTVLDVQKREIAIPERGPAIYEVTKKILVHAGKSASATITEFKKDLTKKGLTLCPDFTSARDVMAKGQR